MTPPILPRVFCDIGILKLQQGVTKIVGEGFPKQTLHILEYESFGAQFAHRAYRFGEHVASVIVAPVFTAKRERLTRWSSGHYSDFIRDIRVIKCFRIHLVKRPTLNNVGVNGLVVSKCPASVAIPLNDRSVMKTGFGHADREPSRSGE
jgi:hypothetical protein